MCTFELGVVFCPCQDKNCKKRIMKIGDDEVWDQVGHIVRVVTCFRASNKPMCLGFFMNEDPDRDLAHCGMNPDDPNNKQDCKRNPIYKLADWRSNLHKVYETVCAECKNCKQPDPSS